MTMEEKMLAAEAACLHSEPYTRGLCVECATKAAMEFMMNTKTVTIQMPPTQPWEVDMQALMKSMYERGLRDGRAIGRTE